jgi:hypothetical protein
MARFARLLLVASAVAVSVVALSGCTVSSSNPPLTTSPRIPTKAPTPTPTAAPALSQALGSCDTAFPESFIDAQLGVKAPPYTALLQYPSSNAPVAIGGLNCDWVDRSKHGIAELQLVVVPVSAVTKSAPDGITCFGAKIESTTETGACSFDRTANGLWLSGVLDSKAKSTNADARAISSAVIASFVGQAASAPPASAPTQQAGAWTHAFNCAALSSAAKVDSVLGESGLEVLDSPDSDQQSPQGVYSAITVEGLHACEWSQKGATPAGEIDGFSADVFPNGAMFEPQVAARSTAVPLTLAGIDKAFVTTDSAGYQTVDVFSGANWVQFSLDTKHTAPVIYPAILPIVKALDAAS